MPEGHVYRLELSAFDLDVLEDVLTDAIGIRSSRKRPDVGDEITALKKIRRTIFAQEPVGTEAALSRTRLRRFETARDAKAKDVEVTSPTPFPLRGQAARMHALRDVLRPLDTGNMAIRELVTACEDAVPDCTVDEIVSALRQTIAEHTAEAERVRD